MSFINIYPAAPMPAVPATVSHVARLEEPLVGVGAVDKYRRALVYQTFSGRPRTTAECAYCGARCQTKQRHGELVVQRQ